MAAEHSCLSPAPALPHLSSLLPCPFSPPSLPRAVATGHYARLAPPEGPGNGGAPRLLRGVDALKDQTYFLATVQPGALRRVLFPVGDLQKPEVRRIAAEEGLAPADRRSSAGICFVGACPRRLATSEPAPALCCGS